MHTEVDMKVLNTEETRRNIGYGEGIRYGKTMSVRLVE